MSLPEQSCSGCIYTLRSGCFTRSRSLMIPDARRICQARASDRHELTPMSHVRSAKLRSAVLVMYFVTYSIRPPVSLRRGSTVFLP